MDADGVPVVEWGRTGGTFVMGGFRSWSGDGRYVRQARGRHGCGIPRQGMSDRLDGTIPAKSIRPLRDILPTLSASRGVPNASLDTDDTEVGMDADGVPVVEWRRTGGTFVMGGFGGMSDRLDGTIPAKSIRPLRDILPTLSASRGVPDASLDTKVGMDADGVPVVEWERTGETFVMGRLGGMSDRLDETIPAKSVR